MFKKSISAITLITFLSLSLNAFAASTSLSDVNSLGQYISTGMEKYESPITVNYTHPSDITSAVMNNILSGQYIKDDYTAVSYSYISLKEITNKDNPSTVDLTITPTYVETAEQEAYVNKQVSQILSDVIKTGMTDYQKTAALHDWVVSHVKYDTTLQEITDYSALTDGKTVCRGYSMLLYKLLTGAGLNSHIVLGEVVSGSRLRYSSTGHAWNMVQLGGNWYFIDSTNDGLSTDSETKFFLVSGKVLQQNGFSWDGSKYPTAANSYGSTVSATGSASSSGSTSTVPTAAVSKIRISRLQYSASPVTLSVTAINNDGTKSKISNSQVKWVSSNTNVATVDNNGVVTFTGNTGNVRITAASGNITASVSTNVHFVMGMTKIKYSTASQQVQIYKVYSNRVTVPLTGITWASSNTSIASIDSNGHLTFTGSAGYVKITGTYNGQTVSQLVVAGNRHDKTMRGRFSLNREF